MTDCSEEYTRILKELEELGKRLMALCHRWPCQRHWQCPASHRWCRLFLNGWTAIAWIASRGLSEAQEGLIEERQYVLLDVVRGLKLLSAICDLHSLERRPNRLGWLLTEATLTVQRANAYLQEQETEPDK